MKEIRALSKDTRMLLALLLDQDRIMEDGKVEVKDVCEAWDGAMQMYAEEAAEKARKEVMKEAAEEKEGAVNKVKQEAAKEKNEIEKLAEKFHNLLCILSKKQKYDDLQKVLDDKEYCEHLYAIYGI